MSYTVQMWVCIYVSILCMNTISLMYWFRDPQFVFIIFITNHQKQADTDYSSAALDCDPSLDNPNTMINTNLFDQHLAEIMFIA